MFREIGWEITGWWGLYILAIIAIGFMAHAFYQRYRLWQLGKPDDRLGNLWDRIKWFITGGIVDAILHRRLLRIGGGSGASRLRPKEAFPGLIHILILGGALLLLIGAGMDFIAHYWVFFMHGGVYQGFCLVDDLGGVLIIIGVILAFIRRYAMKPARLDTGPEDAVSLGLILGIVITGFILTGLRIATMSHLSVDELEAEFGGWTPGYEAWWSFLGYTFYNLFKGIPESTVTMLYQGFWWFHVVVVSGTVIYLSLSFNKLSHILVAPINAFFRSFRPRGALVPMDIEGAMEREETLGVNKIEGFTWKQLLDLDACTRCGRCEDNCPAHLSGKNLSPKNVIQNLKTHLAERGSALLAKGGVAVAEGGADPEEEIPSIIGTIISEEDIWSCTTCRACQEACPVYVEHIDKMIDMRRNLVLEESRMPETAEGLLRCIEERGHSCRGTMHTRTEWTEGLDIKIVGEDKDINILYWTGCAAALEDRNMKVAIALAKILNAAGVNYGILGTEESCCGDPARRLGNEYLFQMQAQKNIEILKSYGIKKIVTACPHCFNTLKNEYPQFGGNFEVIHHTEFIAQLLKEGRLRLDIATDGSRLVTYHDSCYLGRYNQIYREPRQILSSMPQNKLVEMARSWDRGFCCGGGGGCFWMEEREGRRLNEMRTEDVISVNASIVATACPYCLQMFEDAIKAKEVEESVKAKDIAELLAESLP